ncbi:tRNA (uracil(54)-C(5))-methyltransferase-like [Symbiodinium microadriaticum]|uniref:tRNA (Uracil(54)-C(5))-methyltransferase-like n=1 Tax=Symbiodinium microadriaticum TaxID=2951 RepID=A0A1Q9EHK0_SYMMI|nr:tRNA (uracil(54)-C(5))-methyltransferase-like [Symbiodinium microadriaticum]
MVQTTTIKEEVDPFVTELAASGLGICSIYHLYNDEVTDAPRPNALALGSDGQGAGRRLEMPMLELKLEIGPLSFFNPNTTTCRFLMETAIRQTPGERYLKLRKSILLDIFCGIGTIGLCAAGHCAKVVGEVQERAITLYCQQVIGVDIVEENIEVGKAEEVVPKILGDMDTSLEVFVSHSQ